VTSFTLQELAPGTSSSLDGGLAHARNLPKSIDSSKISLQSCQVRVFEGFIFINLTPEGEALVPDFDSMAEPLRPWIAQADPRHTKIAHVESFHSNANWKATHENYFECYHCPGAHPEWMKAQLHAQRDAIGTPQAIESFEKRNRVWESKARELGHMAGSMNENVGLPGTENLCAQMFFAGRMLTNDNARDLYNSLTPDGSEMPTKLLGSYKEDDEGQVD
jgi:phenylpropionate dioxygenase-like ring-hydroxylating dioxygenase large terminal subunit